MALKRPRSMAKSHRNPLSLPMDDSLPLKQRKPVPHAFVLEALAPLSPCTRPMFGCLAVYVKDKIVLILRDKPTNTSDNGVWLATTRDHHDTLRREFPNMRSIQVLGKPDTGWQVLPADAADFEAAAQRACDLVLAGDAHWRPRWKACELTELMQGCIAARPVPSSACAACSRTSSRSMPMKDWTRFLRIGMRWTSCNRVEPLLME